MGIELVLPVYDLSMTYIVGMISDDGLSISADGLNQRYMVETGESLDIKYDAQKVWQINDYIVAGFAGSVLNLEGFVKSYKTFIEPLDIKEVKTLAQHLSKGFIAAYEDLAEKKSQYLEVMIGGFDIDKYGRPVGEPKLYVFSNRPGNDGSNRYQFATVGYVDEKLTSLIGVLYESSDKSIMAVDKIAYEAIKTSAELNFSGVGGDITIHHATTAGVERAKFKVGYTGDMSKKKFLNLIKKASTPVPKEQDKQLFDNS